MCGHDGGRPLGVLETLVALNYYYPGVPAVEIKHRDWSTFWFPDRPWSVMKPFYWGWTPFIIGFAYLAPLDGSVGVDRSLELKWDGGPWAHIYDIYFGTDPNPPLQGNYLLDRLFGARVHLIPAGPDPRFAVAPDEEERVRQIVEEMRARGERPYVIPVGGSSGVGALGYAFGTRELVEQLESMQIAPTRMYYASGSRGTQAGLELGSRLFSPPYQLHGIAVSGGEEEKRVRAARVATEAAALLGAEVSIVPEELVTRELDPPAAVWSESDPAATPQTRRSARG